MKVILILSGKGGVGKTTIAVELARRLSEKNNTGLLDADLHGPNVLNMLSNEPVRMKAANNKLLPVKVKSNLVVASIGALIEPDAAVIWRGPLKFKAINQFVRDVNWGDIEYLVVDLPPGTGDELITAAQTLNTPENVTGAIIVSSPQKIAMADMKRAIDFCNKMNISIIGIIENMSGEMFGEGTVEEYCKNKGLPFLASVPLARCISESCEKNVSIKENCSPEINKKFDEIVNKTVEWFNKIYERTE